MNAFCLALTVLLSLATLAPPAHAVAGGGKSSSQEEGWDDGNEGWSDWGGAGRKNFMPNEEDSEEREGAADERPGSLAEEGLSRPGFANPSEPFRFRMVTNGSKIDRRHGNYSKYYRR